MARSVCRSGTPFSAASTPLVTAAAASAPLVTTAPAVVGVRVVCCTAMLPFANEIELSHLRCELFHTIQTPYNIVNVVNTGEAVQNYRGVGRPACKGIESSHLRCIAGGTGKRIEGYSSTTTPPDRVEPFTLRRCNQSILISFDQSILIRAHSFIRSRQPSPIHIAWCLLLGRQGGQASSDYHTCGDFWPTALWRHSPVSVQNMYLESSFHPWSATVSANQAIVSIVYGMCMEDPYT